MKRSPSFVIDTFVFELGVKLMHLSNWKSCRAELETALKIGFVLSPESFIVSWECKWKEALEVMGIR